MEDKEIHEFAQFHQGYVGGYVQLADTKAGAVFTVMAAVLGYLLSQNDLRQHLNLMCDWRTVLAWMTIGSLVAAALISFVVMPNNFRSKPGPIYFRSVAEYDDADAYVAALRGLTPDQLASAMAVQSFDLSKVCTRKYRRLTWAMRTSLLAVALSAFAIWMLGL